MPSVPPDPASPWAALAVVSAVVGVLWAFVVLPYKRREQAQKDAHSSPEPINTPGDQRPSD